MVKQLKGERHESNWKHMNQDTRKRFCKFSAFFFFWQFTVFKWSKMWQEDDEGGGEKKITKTLKHYLSIKVSCNSVANAGGTQSREGRNEIQFLLNIDP